MPKPLLNYKFYAIGLDFERVPTLLTFLVYDATSQLAAKRRLLKDEKHLRVLRKYSLGSKTVRFTPFVCDATGAVRPEDAKREAQFRHTYAQQEPSYV